MWEFIKLILVVFILTPIVVIAFAMLRVVVRAFWGKE